MPLIVQSTKKNTTSFNLTTIKTQMQIATNSKATLEDTQVAIGNMYQNGTSQKLSPQAQKAVQALARYIHANKAGQTFAFVLGKDHQDHHLLLLTIANNLAKPRIDVSLQKTINQSLTSIQRQDVISLVKQLPWATKALQKAEFGILFWVYQNRLSSQEAMPGTSNVPSSITAVNFQRVKTPQEQLQDEAWAKMMQVVYDLTSSQLEIRANAQQLPSQTKITTSHIVLAIQKLITDDDALSKAASKLIKEDNIEVQRDDKTGAMIITIKNYGNDKIITIFGFKATATALVVAQAKIKVAKDGAILPTKLTQVFHGQMPRASDVNAPTKDGVTFEFKSATVVNNNGESTLTYKVDAHPQVEEGIAKEVTFIVGGFETQAQAVERITIQAKIDDAQDGASLPTRSIQVFHGQMPRVSDVNAPTKDGVTFEFKSATVVNNNGESTLTYKVDAHPQVEGAIAKEVTFIVGGFETQVQAVERITAQAKIDGAQDGASLPTRSIQVFHGQMPRASDVNAPTKDGVTFEFKSATVVNNNGESTLTYKVDAHPQVEGAIAKEVTFIVGGFETQAQAVERIAKIATLAQVAIQNLVAANFTTGINKNQIASVGTPNKAHVISDIEKQINDKDAQALILLSDITITSDNIAKTVTIVIHNHGPIKTITILGFKFISIKDYLDQLLNAIPSSGGVFIIPKGITSSQFAQYVNAMGNVFEKGAFIMNKFAEQYRAKITSLIIPNSFTMIGAWFQHFDKITSLTIPNSVTTIGISAFASAQLTSLHIPASVISIGFKAFASSPLTNVNIFIDVVFVYGSPFKASVTIKRIPRPTS